MPGLPWSRHTVGLRSRANDFRSWQNAGRRSNHALATGTKRMQAYYRHLQKALVKHFHIDEDVPFSDLPERFKQALYFGTNGTPIEMSFSDNGEQKVAKPFEGLVPQMQRLYDQTQSEFTRHRIRSFMTREPCK